MQFLIDNNITDKGEFQLTDALEAMRLKGLKLMPGKVDHWMDCGNKDATVDTNSSMLGFLNGMPELRGQNIKIENSTIIEPCYIGDGAEIKDSKIGPGVSIGAHTKVENCTLTNTIIQTESVVKDIDLDNSMIGNNAEVSGKFKTLSIGDFSKLEA
jgi:glucose-1-phosphate thymidylyltransferase